MTHHRRGFAPHRLAIAVVVALFAMLQTPRAQSSLFLSAEPGSIFVSTSSNVLWELRIPIGVSVVPNGVYLQRLISSKWSVVGLLYNDGTHGDKVANDSIYTATVPLQETVGPVSFRASVPVPGQLLRVLSNTVALEVVPPQGLDVVAGSHDLFVEVGSSVNVTTAVNLFKQNPGPATVTLQTVVNPNVGGLVVTSDYVPAGYATTSTGALTFVLNQSFQANAIGVFTVQNTALLQTTSVSANDVITIHVLPVGGDPKILPVGAAPEGVQLGLATDLVFTAMTAHFNTPATQLDLIQLPLGTLAGILKDDGSGGDLEAGDGVFSGTVPVIATSETPLRFVARGAFPGVAGMRETPPFVLKVVCYPTRMLPAARHPALTDPSTGEPFVGQQLLVRFRDGTSCARQAQVAAAVGGTIVGTSPGSGLHQVDLPAATSASALSAAIAALKAQSDVLDAKVDFLGVFTTSNPPNDPVFKFGYAPQLIRADEAWVIARGSPLIIGVVDTGVDYTHEDLKGKVLVLNGSDFVGGDDDPRDEDPLGHGTFVAGIAAAQTNNGIGIAGIAWNSKILAVRSVGKSSSTNLADGIRFAANNGAKIINLSTAKLFNITEVHEAVKYAVAKGSLVVSAAGNLDLVPARTPLYPCAHPEVLCVGATTRLDQRAGFSNYGSHVDIAAPGENIYSLIAGGGFGYDSGTSYSAPIVAGAAALVWSHFPSWTAEEVRTRLTATAVPMPGADLGAGRVDAFEAVFNGSFEDDVIGWKVTGTAGAQQKLGSIVPTHRNRLAMASSGPDETQIATTILQEFTIQPGVTSFVLKFDYNFVTEEYPEYVHEGFNDDMVIVLVRRDGSEMVLAFESVDGSLFGFVNGIDFPGGDSTVGATGWRSVSRTVIVEPGKGAFKIVVRDRGDGIYDSNVLIDNIRFK